MDVSSIYSLMLDAVDGKIEYDIKADKGPQGAITRLTGALDARCPQTQPLRLLRCLGHQHIGMLLLPWVGALMGLVCCCLAGIVGLACADGRQALLPERRRGVSVRQMVRGGLEEGRPKRSSSGVADKPWKGAGPAGVQWPGSLHHHVW